MLKIDKIFAFTLESPSVLNIQTIEKNGSTNHIYVRGITNNGTKILVYIDGNYENNAQIKQNNNEELNVFEYYSENPLTKGKHEIKVIAESEVLASMSAPVIQNITIYKTIENSATTNKLSTTNTTQTTNNSIPSTPEIATPYNNQIFERNWIIVSGLTDNNTKINIFLNGNFIGSTDYLTDNSGTASFNYKIKNLQNNNKIYIQSETRNGTLSAKSQTISFTIKERKNIEIIPVKNISEKTKPIIAQKETTILKVNTATNTPENNTIATSSTSTINIDTQNNNTNIATNSETTTTQNENTGSANKGIFILFLMAIIIWITLINKELFMEKIRGKKNKEYKVENGDKINFEKPEAKEESKKNNQD